MKLAWDLFRHYLLSRRAGALIRTVAWLCVSGVAMGVMSLVVVISVMNGFNDTIKNRLLAAEPHLVVQVPGANTAEKLKGHPVQATLAQSKDVKAELFENQTVILRTVDGLFGGAIAKGIEPQALGRMMRELQKLNVQTQSPGAGLSIPEIEDESTQLSSGEVYIGIDLARGLGIFEGDKVVVIAPEALLLPVGEAPPFERVTVKGLIATNVPDIDSKVLFYTRGQTFMAFRNNASFEAGYEVRLPDADDYEDVKAAAEAKGATVQTWIERNSALFYALKMEKLAIGMFLGLSALIASFSIVTVLVLLLAQKRKDIGVLMGMGLSQLKTRKLFVQVGLILSSIGIGGGLILGILICWIVDTYPLTIPYSEIYYDTTIPAKMNFGFILGILIVSSAIAFISAYLPARVATRMLPAEALRKAPGS